ncbi:MAG: response regulator [Sphingobacteriia bacterium]|jgi:CheY-like chemotaxis protein
MINKVLCVDDDSISLTISRLLLKRTGFAENVLSAVDGHDALLFFEKLFENNSNPELDIPNLILLDINMPVMNGWEFLDAFIEQYGNKLHNTRVVILSSTIDPEDFARAKKYAIVTQFLSKPLSVETLLELKENDFVKNFFN